MLIGIEIRVVPKDIRRRKSFHRHSIVENPKWIIQHSEPEQEYLSDMNSTTSLRGNKPRLFSPSNSEDRPEIRESFRGSLRQGASNQVNPTSLQSTSSYNSQQQFDWKRWYREKVDSDDD